MPGGGLGGVGGDLGKENVQEAGLADLDRFWTRAGCPKWRQVTELGAKMGPRWRQDAPRWGLSGHLEPIGELSSAFWEVLGGIFAEMAEV